MRQNANPYSLDSVLRIVHSLILAERGGFLLHAASAICDGRACLFSGVSGAGKTTMTRLAPPDVTLLTDEISYVRPENVQPNKDAAIAALSRIRHAVLRENWPSQAKTPAPRSRPCFSWSRVRRTASMRFRPRRPSGA